MAHPDDEPDWFFLEEYRRHLESEEDTDDGDDLRMWKDEKEASDDSPQPPPDDRAPTQGELRRENERLRAEVERLRKENLRLLRKVEPDKHEDVRRIVLFVKENREKALDFREAEDLFRWITDSLDSVACGWQGIRGRLKRAGLKPKVKSGTPAAEPTVRRILESDPGNKAGGGD
jgi:hypothetical protein